NDAADSVPAGADLAGGDLAGGDLAGTGPADGDPAAGEYPGRADDVLADMAAPSVYVLGPMVAGGSDISAVTWTGPAIAATTSRDSGRGCTSSARATSRMTSRNGVSSRSPYRHAARSA